LSPDFDEVTLDFLHEYVLNNLTRVEQSKKEKEKKHGLISI